MTWYWYCRHCDQLLEECDGDREDAIVCDDPAECIRSFEWGGDACGYIVCRYCRTPATEVRR